MASAYDHWLEGDCGVSDEDAQEEMILTRADALEAEYRADAAKVAEADEWTAGTLESDHYSAVESALASLSEVEPADLPGSPQLRRVLELAKVHGEARRKQIRQMAEDDARDEFHSANDLADLMQTSAWEKAA